MNGDITAGGAGVQVSSSERWEYLTDEFGEYIEDDDGNYIEVRENSENYANVDVKGDIEAAEYGVKIWNHGGELKVDVEGNVTTAGEQPNPDEWDKEIYGINVLNYADNTTINVQGDLNVIGIHAVPIGEGQHPLYREMQFPCIGITGTIDHNGLHITASG